jgi:hypothetical protein
MCSKALYQLPGSNIVSVYHSSAVAVQLLLLLSLPVVALATLVTTPSDQ